MLLICFFTIVVLATIWPLQSALAVCPLCTVAVVSGLGLSRYLGIDDLITGLWIGGLIVSMISWTIDWLRKKQWNWPARNWTIIILYWALIIVPLYFYGHLSNQASCLCGVNRLLLGLANGAIGFWAGVEWHNYLKINNGNKVYFPFQRVVLPLIPLILMSLFYNHLLQ